MKDIQTNLNNPNIFLHIPDMFEFEPTHNTYMGMFEGMCYHLLDSSSKHNSGKTFHSDRSSKEIDMKHKRHWLSMYMFLMGRYLDIALDLLYLKSLSKCNNHYCMCIHNRHLEYIEWTSCIEYIGFMSIKCKENCIDMLKLQITEGLKQQSCSL